MHSKVEGLRTAIQILKGVSGLSSKALVLLSEFSNAIAMFDRVSLIMETYGIKTFEDNDDTCFSLNQNIGGRPTYVTWSVRFDAEDTSDKASLAVSFCATLTVKDPELQATFEFMLEFQPGTGGWRRTSFAEVEDPALFRDGILPWYASKEDLDVEITEHEALNFLEAMARKAADQ